VLWEKKAMGSSKIILLCGMCISIGFYAYAILDVNSEIMQLGQSKSYQVQALEIANTGAQIAAYYLATPTWSDGLSKTNYSLYGGKLTYSIDMSNYYYGQATVTSIGDFGGVKVKQVAYLTKTKPAYRLSRRSWNMWTINQIYTTQL
jgi:hypothetical protein